MAFKYAFYFLSLFKNHVKTNIYCLIQWNICEQRLNVKRCHKKIWILINNFFGKRKEIFDNCIFIDWKLLQYWYKTFCKVLIISANCRENWTEWGYIIVISCTFMNFAQSIHNTWFTATWS